MSGIYYFVALAVLVIGFAGQAQDDNMNPVSMEANGKHSRLHNTAALMIAIILITVAGLRFNMGTDYTGYSKYLDRYANGAWHNLIRYNEPGIGFIARACRFVYDDYPLFMFACAAITIGLYSFQISKYSPTFMVSFLVFLFGGCWTGAFNGVRQYLAAAVLFAGHRLILEKKFWKYALVVFVASLFHVSALVMILPYFLLRRKVDLKQIVLLAVGAVIIRFSYDYILDFIGFYKGQALSSNYSYITNSVNILRIAVSFVPLILFGLLCDKKNMTNEETFYMNCIALNAFGMLATMGSTYLARLGDYTFATVTIGYGFFLNRIRDRRTRRIVTFFAIVLYAVFFWYEVSISPALRDFQWIWNRTY